MSRQAFVFGAAFVGVYAEAFKFTGNNLKAFFQGTDLLEKARFLQHIQEYLMRVAGFRDFLIRHGIPQ